MLGYSVVQGMLIWNFRKFLPLIFLCFFLSICLCFLSECPFFCGSLHYQLFRCISTIAVSSTCPTWKGKPGCTAFWERNAISRAVRKAMDLLSTRREPEKRSTKGIWKATLAHAHACRSFLPTKIHISSPIWVRVQNPRGNSYGGDDVWKLPGFSDLFNP